MMTPSLAEIAAALDEAIMRCLTIDAQLLRDKGATTRELRKMLDIKRQQYAEDARRSLAQAALDLDCDDDSAPMWLH